MKVLLTVEVLLGLVPYWGMAFPGLPQRKKPQPWTTTPSAIPGHWSLAQQRRNGIIHPKTRESRRTTSLQAVSGFPIASLLASPVGALSILAGIIVIHEAGHYLAARSFGIEVEEFSVGIGPKLFGFSAWGNEFNLRLFPLGGYVRFPENYNATLAEEILKEAYAEAMIKKEMESNPPSTLGYKIANALSLWALDRQNRNLRQARLKEQMESYEKLPWWKKARFEEEDLDNTKVDIPYDDNPNLLQNRPWFQRAVVISGGVLFNLLLSFFIYFGEIGGPRGLPSPVFEPGVKVGAIAQASAPAMGILQPGDVILEANGVTLTKTISPSLSEADQAIRDLIAAIRATPEGKEIELEVLRQNENDGGDSYLETVNIKPKRVSTVPLGQDGTLGPQSIGVLLGPNYIQQQKLQSDRPLEAARLAFQYTKTLTVETANGLGSLIQQAFSGGGSGGGSVSGPIGLVKTGSEVVATRDIQTILLFAAAISINLGVINAFPLPALDGGQLLFVLTEAVTRRKIDRRLEQGITGFAVVILLLVSAGAALGDISSIFAR